MSDLDILIKHGREMRIQALEHAVAMIMIDPDNAARFLREKIEKEREELEND